MSDYAPTPSPTPATATTVLPGFCVWTRVGDTDEFTPNCNCGPNAGPGSGPSPKTDGNTIMLPCVAGTTTTPPADLAG